jgi:hypothetical protein
MKFRLLACIALSLTLVQTACKKKEQEVDFRFGYFGFVEKKFVDYNVIDILHDDPAAKHDTTRYQLRTVIGDTVIDNEGRIARKFLRYVRNTSTDSWQLKDVWTAIIDGYRGELVEENQRVIKLVFAPTYEKTWNINAFNMFAQKNVYYDFLHVEASLNGLTFPQTVRVEMQDDQNMIQYKREYETYAEGVGLINRYYKDFTIISADTLKPRIGKEQFVQIINHGFI